ncbi:Fc.00g053840.m01.CDS01 [Cosmosporella sp. VM-42]
MAAPSLLLLPQPPQPSIRVSLDAAYRAPLSAVLARLRNTTHSETLVVAVSCPILHGPAPKNKSTAWEAAQSLLAGVYTIIATICAQLDIATDINAGAGSVDVRVVLVDHDRRRTYYPDYDGGFEANNTAILDLATFASKVHPWRTIFHPNSEEGYDLRSLFLKFSEGKQSFTQSQLVVVEGGISMTTPTQDGTGAQTKGFDTVCLGGTFDHLHPGHKLLLHATVLLLNIPDKDLDKTCTLIVGISGDELLVNKKYPEELQSWDIRAQGVLSFLSTLLEYNTTATLPSTVSKPDELIATFRDRRVQVRCVNIHDPFGPTISEEGVDAIVVSAETRSGGQAINLKRAEKGWKPLEVYEIDVLDAREISEEIAEGGAKTEDFSAKISSTAIRQLRAKAKNLA